MSTAKKAFLALAIAITILPAYYALYSSAFIDNAKVVELNGKVAALELSNKIYEGQNRLLEDQLNDVGTELLLRPARTYEQGFADALSRSKQSDWVDGYHAGVAQMNGSDLLIPSPIQVVPAAAPKEEKKVDLD